MEDAKTWSVTYTKHVKQKRKVYHDGILVLCISTNKVMLYDDCEKLLDSRLLKKDEFVKAGDTLTFNTFLIDVGDLQGNQAPLSDLNVQGRDKKSSAETGSMHVKRCGDNSDWKTHAEKSKTALNPSSVSRKVIKEFKKTARQSHQTPLSSPDSTKSSMKVKWQVLYTTQITQKAKKYHDGILQLASFGIHGRQVMLYDTTGKMLESRFLKKEEIIESGQLLILDVHLVDVGELEQNHEPLEDLNVQWGNCSRAGQTGMLHGQDNMLKVSKTIKRESNSRAPQRYQAAPSSPYSTKSSMKEWQVMYTTQTTQKAKKYRDGILQLVICGFAQRQVKLYDTSRTLLNSRFLKKDEVIECGQSLAFDAHLVDIGDAEQDHESSEELNVQKYNCNEDGKTGIVCRQQTIVKARKAHITGEVQNDAHSKKDVGSNFSCLSTGGIELSLDRPLRDAHQILFSLKKPLSLNNDIRITKAVMEQSHASQLEQDLEGVDRTEAECHKDEIEASDERGNEVQPFKSKVSESKAFSKDQSCETSLPPDGSNRSTDSGEGLELSSSRQISRCSGSQIFKGTENGNSHQRSTIACLQPSGVSSSDNVERKCHEKPKKTEGTYECPSFNLGF